ncbi:MAG TPA: ATP-binding protein [Gaiellaceae bacterium]|nr:ATP-binding protein [Gaiellaceae bacterium]
MDPRINPYTPNAGAPPPALVGRDPELGNFEILLERLRRGYPEQSLLITGLRGVGKTVLLGAFEGRAQNSGWVTVSAEISKDDELGPRIANLVRRALFQVAPKASWTDRVKRAAGVLKSFSLTIASDGSVTAGVDVEAVEGLADTGTLSDDLTDLLVALGEGAKERETGVVFLLDEVQFLRAREFEALIAALHRTVQRQLPITLVGAGLPQLPRLAGEAKSYAERLFRFPQIGRLSPPEAEVALAQPASDLGVAFDPDAIDVIVEYTEGYPYFIQEYGKIVWNLAPEGEPISSSIAEEAQRAVEAKLDESFFRVRAERTTELELRYLRAMAELGPGEQTAGEVAEMMGRKSEQLGPTRARLIDKGLIYTTGHGRGAFTVPQFDRYMRRNYELAPVRP